MKRIICILFLLTSLYSISQEKEEISPIENLDSIISLLKIKIDAQQMQEYDLVKLNNDLKNQLIIYKAKEDYFAAALEDQSNRFSLIVASIIVLIGLVSFSWYRVEKRNINRKFNSLNKNFEEMKNKYIKLEVMLNKTIASASVLISLACRKSKEYVCAFEYSIGAARGWVKSSDVYKENDFKAAISNLKEALKDLSKIRKDNSLKDKLSDKMNSIIRNIEIIQQTDNQEVKDLCAKIRILTIDYRK